MMSPALSQELASPWGQVRREDLNSNLYYRWSKEFLEAGKKSLLRISQIGPERFDDVHV